MENNLIPVNTNMVALFKDGGLDPILNEIKKKVDEFEPDVESGTGRKEIASFAYKIAQSKTFIEKAGKELVHKQKVAINLIDNERKRSRDFLDEQRDRARLPLTEWEEAEKKALEEEERKIRFEADHTEALAEDDLFNRQREVERKEAEFAKQEGERREKEEVERLKKERTEREERLKKEAAEQAKKDAEEAIRKAEEATRRAERNRIAAEERAKIEAEEAANRVKVERFMAEEQAKIDKETAVQKAKQKAEEKARVEKEEAERKAAEIKAIAEKKAANKAHRLKIESEAYGSFINALGCTNEKADEIVHAIKNNEIKNVTINYY